jgi:hypothetical protein
LVEPGVELRGLARQALYHLSHSTNFIFVFDAGSC